MTSTTTDSFDIMKNPISNKLPPEIRNTIYEMVYTLPHRVIFERLPITSDWILTKRSKNMTKGDPLALAKTCKAIREESQSIFFNINTFMLARCPLDEIDKSLRSFGCRITQSNFSALRNVVVEFGNGFRFMPINPKSNIRHEPRTGNHVYLGVLELQVLMKRHQHISFSARFNFEVPAHLVNCGCRLIFLDFELDLNDIPNSLETVMFELRPRLVGKVSPSTRLQFLSQLYLARELIKGDGTVTREDM